MKEHELIKLLKKQGIQFVSHGARHDLYYSPITNKCFTVPRHKKEIPKGTAESILREAGIRRQI